MKFGDIVLVQFPFSDLSSQKVRPSLVLSSKWHISQGNDALFLMISSQTTNIRATDYLLPKDHPEFPVTGLKVTSIFRVDKIHCLEKKLAKKHLGEIGPNIGADLSKKLGQIIGIKIP